MRNILRFIYIVLWGILLQGCVVHSSGWYSGYSRMPKEYREKVTFLDAINTVPSLKKEDGIYAITGELLRKRIEAEEKSLVYWWVPHCNTDFCYPLSYIQSYCNSRGITLYVVAHYYDSERMWIEQKNISAPIVSVNEKHYDTSNTNKYMRLFLNDLFDVEKLSKEDLYSGIYVFNNGKLVSCTRNLDEIITSS
jgi:hypothetical protein